MTNAWVVATIVAVVAGVVGFFVVLRSGAFAAHAIPKGAFAGAAGAALIGVNAIAGLGVFAVLSALGTAGLRRRARSDVATALVLVLMLAVGSAFLSRTSEYGPEIFSLLFGEVLGVSSSELAPTAALGAVCLAAVALAYRPLLYSSASPDLAEARGLRAGWMDLLFLLVVALATAMTVPVVGTLLIFSLMIGPPAAARSVTSRPLAAMAGAVVIALVTVWSAIACSYLSNWPIGFFVGAISAFAYGLGRAWGGVASRRATSRRATSRRATSRGATSRRVASRGGPDPGRPDRADPAAEPTATTGADQPRRNPPDASTYSAPRLGAQLLSILPSFQ